MWRLLAMVLLVSGPAVAAAPDVGAPTGAERTAHLVRSFDVYNLPLGVFGRDGITTESVSGAVTWQAFRLEDPDASTTAVMAAYRERLDGMGFATLFACRNDACGGFDFRFGAAVLPPPAMLMDVRDFAQFTAHREGPDTYVSVLVSRVGGAVYAQTVTVVPAEPTAEVGPEPEIAARTEVDVLPGDERALLGRLMDEGHVPVDGLSFEAGGAQLSPSSAEALDLLARLLTRDAALEVAIVGHSDNVGALDANIALSRRRAEAVRDALVARGVPADRVAAYGVGYLAPLVSNATPEGRALNRRVELVLRSDPE